MGLGELREFERQQEAKERELREREHDLAREALLRMERELHEQQQKEKAISRANAIIDLITPVWHRLFGSSPRITSVYRTGSAAHRRGAVDIATRDPLGTIMATNEILNTAQVGSEALGPDYYVIAEIVEGDTQTNTTFHNGIEGNSRVTKRKATETHIHIQIRKEAVE